MKQIVKLTILVLVAALAIACGRHSNKDLTDAEIRERTMDRTEDMVEDLEGDEKQVELAQEAVDSYLPTVYEIRKLKEPTRAVLRAELISKSPNTTKMQGVVENVGVEMTAAAHGAANTARELHGILRSEQRAELAERWRSRSDRRPPAWIVDAVFKRFLDEIDATDSQYEWALAKKDEWSTVADSIRAKSKRARTVFIAQLEADAPNMSQVHGEIDAMSARLRAVAKDATRDVAVFASTLSDDQRAKIAEMTQTR